MKTQNSMILFLAVLILGLIMIPNVTSAQSSGGKLAGKIIDAESKEPLIGANIILVGTSYGASTDIDGQFYILNIIPGEYNIRIAYIGYQTQEVQAVRVVSGITKELDAALKSSSVELNAVIIEAEKVFFEAKATNTVKVVESEQLAAMPVRGVDRVLSLNAGVVSEEGSGGTAENSTLYVRGGRGGEVLYVIDGVPQNDILQGVNYAQVSQSAVEQASFQVGGFEAKYGQAQSGIVNITTKKGGAGYKIGGEVVSSTFTDSYGYNLYNVNLSGPIIPGQSKHTIFVSGERIWCADGDPHAIDVTFNSDVKTTISALPDNQQAAWRWSAKTFHDLGSANLTLSANLNENESRVYVHRYVKWNSAHNSKTLRDNYSFNAKLSLPISNSAVLNLNGGYRLMKDKSGDGVLINMDLEKWGNPVFNNEISTLSERKAVDDVGIFFQKGRINNFFTKTSNSTISGDADFSAQLSNHLIEIGAGIQLNTLRYYTISPLAIAKDLAEYKDLAIASRNQQPFFFGYDVTGKTETNSGARDTAGSVVKTEPRTPVQISGYIQDRYEISDLVINLGLRFDYIDSKADILKDETLPYGFGNPAIYDDADFKTAESELYFSPRIGLGFPVTASTVFHAQYGVFIQQPRLIDLYTSPMRLEALITDQNFPANSGHIKSEHTTQYEFGFRQVLGDNKAALNLTAFYKNTKGLVNSETRFYQRTAGGELLRYYGPANSDFGTIRGISATLDVARINYITLNINYTLGYAEGTGSSTNSSNNAAFRNNTGEVPVVIAPLDFDRRHTATINFGFNTNKGELGILENVSINAIATYNSGKPYTPLEKMDLLAGVSNYGDTKGYVNSAYGPSAFLISLKVEKTFELDFLRLTPYVWIENLLDSDNIVDVYQSTGSPYTAGFLKTEEGKAVMLSQANPTQYAADYSTFEKDPGNFGIPRQIRLGLRMSLGK